MDVADLYDQHTAALNATSERMSAGSEAGFLVGGLLTVILLTVLLLRLGLRHRREGNVSRQQVKATVLTGLLLGAVPLMVAGFIGAAMQENSGALTANKMAVAEKMAQRTSDRYGVEITAEEVRKAWDQKNKANVEFESVHDGAEKKLNLRFDKDEKKFFVYPVGSNDELPPVK